VDAVLRGAASLQSVCEQTRAGTGCGSCRPEVQRIVDVTCRSLDESAPIASPPPVSATLDPAAADVVVRSPAKDGITAPGSHANA
jgi:NAD(P)H-nitrite reductase large subunit